MITRPAVEYPIVDHCNLRCHDCDHASPYLAARRVPLETIREDIEAAATVLRVKDLNIVGGEALLHPELPEILAVAQASGMAKRVTLVSNGLLLHKAAPVVFERIDRLRISLYPGVELKITHAELKRLAREHGFLLDIRAQDEFLQPFPPERITDTKLVRKIYARCKTAHLWSCHPLYRGYYYKCSRAPIISMTGNGAPGDEDRPPLGADGVKLAGPDLEERLRAYLADKDPIPSCDWCLGTSGRTSAHVQLATGQVKDGLVANAGTGVHLASPLERVPHLARRAARLMKGPPLP